ncbi:MAG: cobalt ECF transporter T component CbiQ [Desulfomonile tiedjei]|nr:cobalt ECF transporter T component CbiQ [Desulfomonile tiedjei]
MFDVFSDIFACRDNALTRMDPRAKLIVAFGMLVAVLTSGKVFMPLVVFLGCVSAMFAVGMPPRLVAIRLAGPAGIVAVLVLLQAFLVNGTPVLNFSLFGWQISASHEGLARGTLLGARVVGCVSVVLLLSSVTPAYKIFHALRWFRVPEGWIEIALLVYRYTFTLLDQTADVAAAQTVRLGYSTMKRSLSSMGVLAGTVLTRSLDQAVRTHEAMTLRGYHGSIPFGPLPEMSASDRLKVGVAIPAVGLLYVCLERWPW